MLMKMKNKKNNQMYSFQNISMNNKSQKINRANNNPKFNRVLIILISLIVLVIIAIVYILLRSPSIQSVDLKKESDLKIIVSYLYKNDPKADLKAYDIKNLNYDVGNYPFTIDNSQVQNNNVQSSSLNWTICATFANSGKDVASYKSSEIMNYDIFQYHRKGEQCYSYKNAQMYGVGGSESFLPVLNQGETDSQTALAKQEKIKELNSQYPLNDNYDFNKISSELTDTYNKLTLNNPPISQTNITNQCVNITKNWRGILEDLNRYYCFSSSYKIVTLNSNTEYNNLLSSISKNALNNGFTKKGPSSSVYAVDSTNPNNKCSVFAEVNFQRTSGAISSNIDKLILVTFCYSNISTTKIPNGFSLYSQNFLVTDANEFSSSLPLNKIFFENS